MSAAKANNHQDTYRATAIALLLIGGLYMLDKLIHFASHGLGWITDKNYLLLYTAAIFLFFKRDKSVGIVLTGLWLVMNIDLVIALLGNVSAYLLPLALLLVGGILLLISKR
ncbi:MAG: hypothetical protein EOM31_01975 [Bacteroidia bacterium]|nr:hypothetical protein [Bacteroidia bacterium]